MDILTQAERERVGPSSAFLFLQAAGRGPLPQVRVALWTESPESDANLIRMFDPEILSQTCSAITFYQLPGHLSGQPS